MKTSFTISVALWAGAALVLSAFAQAPATKTFRAPEAAGGGASFIQRLREGEKVVIVTLGTSLTGGQWRWTEVMLND